MLFQLAARGLRVCCCIAVSSAHDGRDTTGAVLTVGAVDLLPAVVLDAGKGFAACCWAKAGMHKPAKRNKANDNKVAFARFSTGEERTAVSSVVVEV